MIKEIREFFMLCPLLDENTLSIDVLPNEAVSYAIYVLPIARDGTLRKYVNGTKIKGINICFACQFEYNKNTVSQIENVEFFQKLIKWLKTTDNKPNIDGFQKIVVMQMPMLNAVAESGINAEYQLLLQIQYREELL